MEFFKIIFEEDTSILKFRAYDFKNGAYDFPISCLRF